MKEEHLEQAKKFYEEMTSLDSFVMVVLKGHLLIEDKLTKILELNFNNSEYLNETKLTFNQKMLLCKALSAKLDTHWQLIASINTLRNDLAHNLRSSKRKTRFDDLKQKFIKISPKYKKDSDEDIIMLACALCHGFLIGLKDIVQTQKAK